MAWQIKDEWIDLAQARHTVIFHNPDTAAEHHLIHEFNLVACPHCGVPRIDSAWKPIDFEKMKTDTFAKLNAHHQTVMKYCAQHARVRLGTGPK